MPQLEPAAGPPGYSFHLEAFAHVEVARAKYEAISPRRYANFERTFRKALGEVLAGPDSWPPRPSGLRWRKLRKFPYKIVYRFRDGHVAIVAFPHSRMRPRYYRRQLRELDDNAITGLDQDDIGLWLEDDS